MPEMAPVRALKGMKDVLWPASYRWEVLVATFADLAQRTGYGLVLSPMLEEARLFHRGFGDESEVVGKEMYEFDDRDKRRLALRPEGTAPVSPCVHRAPPRGSLESLVRDPGIPPRTAPGWAFPSAPPARCRGDRQQRP